MALTTRRRLQYIEQVARIICDTSMTSHEAEQRNRDDGWSFDLSVPSTNNYLQVTEARLSSDDLAEAIALAEDWNQGNFREARIPRWGGHRPGAGRPARV